MTFREWLFQERGTKLTATGLGSGGMAQHGRRYRMSAKPAKPSKPFKPFSPLKPFK